MTDSSGEARTPQEGLPTVEEVQAIFARARAQEGSALVEVEATLRRYLLHDGEGEWEYQTPPSALPAIAALDSLLAYIKQLEGEQRGGFPTFNDFHVHLTHRAEAAERENERLREALEIIAKGERPADSPAWTTGKSWRIELARDALCGDER